MVHLKPINPSSLIGHTIKNITLIRDKNWLVFNLENIELVIFVSYYINGELMISKNRKKLCYTDILNVIVKDIGWESHLGIEVTNLFVISTEGDVYRFNILDSGIFSDILSRTNIYDYTKYKQEIMERNHKIERQKNKLKSGIKSILGKEDFYTKI